MGFFKRIRIRINMFRLRRELEKMERMKERFPVGTLERTVIDSVLPVTKQVYRSLEK